MDISLQAYLYFLLTRVSMRPIFSERADLPKVRRRIERMDYWGRYLDGDLIREQQKIEDISCQWIHFPGGDRARVVLYLHGGGFCTRTPVTHGQLLANICKSVGATGLMPDYRLAPEHPFPASFEDSIAVYGWLLENGFQAEKIVLAGDSAGAALVLGTLLQARQAGLPQPACAVLISPWSGRPFVARPGQKERDAVLSRAALTAFYQAWKPFAIQDHPLADLTANDFSGLPPLLIQAGGNEILLPEAEQWAQQARLAGVDVTLQVFPGMAHAFQVAGFLPETKSALEKIARFVAEFLQ